MQKSESEVSHVILAVFSIQKSKRGSSISLRVYPKSLLPIFLFTNFYKFYQGYRLVNLSYN